MNGTNEEKTKLQPFPLVENENYLLKMSNGIYVVAVWGDGRFYNEYYATMIEDAIESYVAIKDLGLWRIKKNMIWIHWK